ncbi:MAG: NmrA family NAD(P)-binding protein [Solirubrobacterales bacterium]|nr:NmrA family NAD(P)-binding protein [Solirubrobacterales bacterium]
MILIATAGKVGSEAARLLAQQDAPVRVLVRDPDKATVLAQLGVDVAEGDLDDVTSIDAAMQGVTAVVLVSPAVPAQELSLIDSAARARVGHVVKITSKASADSPIARQRGQAEIEAGLLGSGLDYTLLRNNFYMQNFLMLAPAIAQTSSFGAAAGDGQVGFVDTRDVAAVAAEIAAAPAGHAGATYLLTGPQLLSYADVAAALSKVLGRPIAFHTRTREQDKQEMIDAGLPRELADMNAHAVSLIADDDAAWLSQDVPSVLGRPARSFAQFATDHVAAFAPER